MDKPQFDSAIHKMTHLYSNDPHFKRMADAALEWMQQGHHETAIRVAVQFAAYRHRRAKQ